MSALSTKWCSYCRQAGHNDEECWCTRPLQTAAVGVDWAKVTCGVPFTFKAQAATVCGCIGPQRGEPKCPCQMRGVIKRDGRWIQTEVDLGPAA